MKVNFKEIKNRAKTTIKSHYLMFVIGLLLCAMLGVDYTFSTYSFSLLNIHFQHIHSLSLRVVMKRHIMRSPRQFQIVPTSMKKVKLSLTTVLLM